MFRFAFALTIVAAIGVKSKSEKTEPEFPEPDELVNSEEQPIDTQEDEVPEGELAQDGAKKLKCWLPKMYDGH